MAIFFGIAVASLLFTTFQGRVAAVWPANAFLLATLLRARIDERLQLALAALAANFAANLVTGDTIVKAALLSSLNMLEIGLCLAVLTQVLRQPLDLVRPRHLLLFSTAAILAPLPGAAIAASQLSGSVTGEGLRTLTTWWAADSLGMLAFGPVALLLANGEVRELIAGGRLPKTLLNAALLVVTLSLVFLQSSFPLLFLIPPVLTLITFQLGLAGAGWAMIVTAMFAIVAFLNGQGPTTLVGGGPEVQLQTLQFFLAFVVVTTLPLAAVLNGRRLLEARVATEHAAAQALSLRLDSGHKVAQMAQEAAGVGYWTYRPDSQVTTWSHHMYTLYGLENDGEIPPFDELLERIAPEDRDRAAEQIRKSLEDGGEHSLELRIGTDEAQRIVMAGTRLAQMPDGGRALLGVMVDVTGIRRAEAALVDSESRYRQLADTVPDLIVRITDGRMTYVSLACRRFGYEPEDLVGRSMAELVHPGDLAAAMRRGRDNAAGVPIDPSIRREQRVRTAGGDWVWLEGNPRQVVDAAGNVVEVINVYRDVSRRRALEDELVAARASAERAGQAKTDFMSNVSHELRTPLTAIIGFSSLLQATGGLEGRNAMFVERIDKAGKTLLALVNQVLDFSRIEAGEVEAEALPVRLGDVLTEAIGLVAPQALAKDLSLATESEIGDLYFLGDAGRVRQVLVNLLGNAVKFTRTGSVTLKLLADGSQRTKFMVCDTGPGIPLDRQHLIFERYTQVDGSTTRAHGGTGLGLAISYGLIQAMGGDIGVESEEGRGSVFWFSIPTPPVIVSGEVAAVA